MHRCSDTDVTEVFASAILREVPLAQISTYLDVLGKDTGPLSIGDACGNGCGSGCGNNCIRPIDQFGHTALSLEQLNKVVADQAGLRNALGKELSSVARMIC